MVRGRTEAIGDPRRQSHDDLDGKARTAAANLMIAMSATNSDDT